MDQRTCSAIVALTVMGCGGSSAALGTHTLTDDSGSPTVDAARDHVSGDDGPGNGALESGAESGAPTPYFGKVQFNRQNQGNAVAYQAQAKLLPTGSMVSALACPPGATISGSCCFVAGADAGANPFESVSAGTLSLAVGGTSLASLTYDAQAMQYELFSAVDPPAMTSWNADDVMHVSAAGGTVQAFAGSVTMPAPLQGLSVNPNVSPMVSVSTDWTVTWTPGQGASKVLLTLSGSGDEIKCVVDEAAGAVTLPAAFLGHFTPGSGANVVLVDAVSVATASSPNATIELGAFNEVFDIVDLRP
jgi:hypothetical protein